MSEDYSVKLNKNALGSQVVKLYGKIKYMIYCIMFLAAAGLFLYYFIQNDDPNIFFKIVNILAMIVMFLLAIDSFLVFTSRVILCEKGFVLTGLYYKHVCLYSDYKVDYKHFVFTVHGVGIGGIGAAGGLTGSSAGGTGRERNVYEILITHTGHGKAVKISSDHFGKLKKKVNMFNEEQKKNKGFIIEWQPDPTNCTDQEDKSSEE